MDALQLISGGPLGGENSQGRQPKVVFSKRDMTAWELTEKSTASLSVKHVEEGST